MGLCVLKIYESSAKIDDKLLSEKNFNRKNGCTIKFYYSYAMF